MENKKSYTRPMLDVMEVCFDDRSVLAASNMVPDGQYDAGDYDLGAGGWW